MARGAARVMGFNLMENFDRPYGATSLTDFWRRWHISLSTWLRDYIFEPVAMGLRDWGIYAILLAFNLTFLISGFWHGASWTYVVWGLLHGLGLSIEVIFSKQRKKLSKSMPLWLFAPIMWFITFSFVNFTYIFFRAKSITDANIIISKISSWLVSDAIHNGGLSSLYNAIILLLTPEQFTIDCLLILFLVSADALHARFDLGKRLVSSPVWIRWAVYQAAILIIAFFGQWLGARSFIYFQF